MDLSFSTSGTANPCDYQTVAERKLIREAALEYGAIPAYGDLSPEDRDRWKTHLAQRFRKSKSEVGPDDWEQANGWKYTSLTWVSLDTGLRPLEVKRAKTTWVDIENQILRILREESRKNSENWIVGLTERTANALSRWLDEREMYDHYQRREEYWLTQGEIPTRQVHFGTC